MTTSSSIKYFKKQKIFAQLQSISPVRFVPIDDLVTNGAYGVILTLAYARGIMDSGDEQINTTFVFMNADFVLADGGLGHLGNLIDVGHPVIMASSLRVNSEEVYPKLLNKVGADGLIVMPSRELVKLSIPNLHKTVIGKTMTQNLLTCSTHNQFYWKVNQSTILARCHLIFMLAISPEVPLVKVNSYCDYGFVPEMVPSGKFYLVPDSDDIFIMEMSPKEQESQFISFGNPSIAKIASNLSVWVTQEHANFATVDTVFHSDELPANLADVRLKASNFINELKKIMPNPVSHINHFYWRGGLADWHSRRPKGSIYPTIVQNMSTPFNSGKPSTGMAPLISRLRSFVKIMLLGTNVSSIFSPNWMNQKLVSSWFEHIDVAKRPFVVVIGDNSDPYIDHMLNKFGGRLFATKNISEVGVCDHIIMFCVRAQVTKIKTTLNELNMKILPGGELALFVSHPGGENDPSNFTSELCSYLDDILPDHWQNLDVSICTVGGLTVRRLYINLLELQNTFPKTIWKVPISIVAVGKWMIIMSLIAAYNILEYYRLRQNSNQVTEYSSSILIKFRRSSD